KRMDSQAKPARRRRSAMSGWQPASSGVTEGRRMSSLVSCRTSVMPTGPSPRPSPASGRGSRTREARFEGVVAETLRDAAVAGDDHRATDELRILLQQQLPFRVRTGRLAVRGQVAPGGRRLVDHGVPPAQCVAPGEQGFRRLALVAVVDEVMFDAETLQPLARLAAGVAVGQAV